MQPPAMSNRHSVLGVAICLAVSATPAATVAQDSSASTSPIICTEPVAPTCMESDITYSSQQRIDRCQRTIARYQDQLDDYLACLEKKIRQKRTKGERILKEFQQRSAGDAGG